MNKIERKDTVRELESHAKHLVAFIEAGNYHKAVFHANNAKGCLNALLGELNMSVTEEID